MPNEHKPVVYVETNWLVAFVLPHDGSHQEAVRLRHDMHAGTCEVRIPQASFLEAEERIAKVMQDIPRQHEFLANMWNEALRNGVSGLENVVKALLALITLQDYLTQALAPLKKAASARFKSQSRFERRRIIYSCKRCVIEVLERILTCILGLQNLRIYG